MWGVMAKQKTVSSKDKLLTKSREALYLQILGLRRSLLDTKPKMLREKYSICCQICAFGNWKFSDVYFVTSDSFIIHFSVTQTKNVSYYFIFFLFNLFVKALYSMMYLNDEREPFVNVFTCSLFVVSTHVSTFFIIRSVFMRVVTAWIV